MKRLSLFGIIVLFVAVLSSCISERYRYYSDIELQPTAATGNFANKKTFERLLYDIWESGFIKKNDLTKQEILNNTYGVFWKSEDPLSEPEGRALYQQRAGQKDILMLNAKLFGHLEPSSNPGHWRKVRVMQPDKLIKDTLVHELFHDFWHNILDRRKKSLFSYEAEIFFVEIMMANTRKDRIQLLHSFGYNQAEEEFFKFFKALQDIKKKYNHEKASGTELYATLAGRAFSGVTIIPNQFKKYYSGLLSVEALYQNLFFHSTGSINYNDSIPETVEIENPVQIKELLEEQPMLINAKDENGWTLLHQASYAGIKEAVEILIEKGASLNTPTRMNTWTPIFLASLRGHREIADFLIKKGAQVDIQDNRGRSPLHIAAMRGHNELILLFIQNGIRINREDDLGMTPLHVAALSGQKETASFLVSRKANAKQKDSAGQTPLHLASLEGDKDLAKLLIEEGVNIDERDERGETALHIAAFCGHKKVIELLIKGGAKLDIQNTDNETPLEIAARTGHNEIAEMLRSANRIDKDIS